MGWQRIQRKGKVDPRRFVGDRVEVAIPLNETPPREWIRYFEWLDEDHRRERNEDYPPVRVEGKQVVLWPKEDQLEGWVMIISERIEKANKDYENTVQTNERAREDTERRAIEAQQRRLEELRRRAAKL
jgi:hypothetical protein